MEVKVTVDDKLVQEVKDARSALAKLKTAIDKARKAATMWFASDGLKLSDESEKKINDAHLIYDRKLAEMTGVIAEHILGQKIDIDADSNNDIEASNNKNQETDNKDESYRQVKDPAGSAAPVPMTLRKMAAQMQDEQVKQEEKEPAADTEIPAPTEELPEFLDRVKKAATKEDINKLVGDARIATTGSEAKGLVFYGDPFVTNKDYALLQQALADREQELKKKEVKDYRFLRRAGDFKSSFAVRIAFDLYRRIRGDKDVNLDRLRDLAGLLADEAEKAQLLAQINTYCRNINQGKD